jgi:hypothetical protein
LPVSIYIALACVISLISAAVLSETHQRDLHAVE